MFVKVTQREELWIHWRERKKGKKGSIGTKKDSIGANERIHWPEQRWRTHNCDCEEMSQ